MQLQIPFLSFPSTAGCNEGPKTRQALSSYIAQHEFLPTPRGRGCPAIPRSTETMGHGATQPVGQIPPAASPGSKPVPQERRQATAFCPTYLNTDNLHHVGHKLVFYFYQTLSIAENMAGRNLSYHLAIRNKLSCYKLPVMQTVFPS